MTGSASAAYADTSHEATLRKRIGEAVDRMHSVLPGQAPLRNFVHRNPLHGYQHLPFERALAASADLTGSRSYLTDEDYRRCYQQGRIDDRDIQYTFAQQDSHLRGSACAATIGGLAIMRRDVLRIGLLYGVDPLPALHFRWLLAEQNITKCFQHDVPAPQRQQVLTAAADQNENSAVSELWEACLAAFGHGRQNLHSQDLVEMPAAVDLGLLATIGTADPQGSLHRHLREDTATRVDQAFGDLGRRQTMRGLLKSFSGQDLLEFVRPLLIRLCGVHLDEGLAPWSLPGRDKGLYAAWRRLARTDFAYALHGLSGWEESLSSLPPDALAAVIAQLRALGLAEDRWEGYLRLLALDIPGWSGMISWRQRRPEYAANAEARVHLLDYLAVRLFLDQQYMKRICRDTWDLEANVPVLQRYFATRLSEAAVRLHVFADTLPEYLTDRAKALTENAMPWLAQRQAWRQVADMICAWKYSHEASTQQSLSHGVWQLFRLAQHLGLSASAIRATSTAELQRLLQPLQELTPDMKGILWTVAYEHNYRDALINALANNNERGRWAHRQERPEAQIVFCMDDREEGFRRHLEEHNPRLETLGAAGFFGVVINWRGLDDANSTPSCPVHTLPAHEVRELSRTGTDDQLSVHQRGLSLQLRLRLLYQRARRNLLSAHLLIDILAPAMVLNFAARVLLPSMQARIANALHDRMVPGVATGVAVTAVDEGTEADTLHQRLGFTDMEQADRVAALLRSIGLTSGFAPLVVLMAHGSDSQNNPYLAAYDCGACGARHGGGNSRSFAAMVNRPVIRMLLRARDISIPDDTWFIGAEHNTGDERVVWFDRQDIGERRQDALKKLEAELVQAGRSSAHERCRRFASAPHELTPSKALRQVIRRCSDFSQTRPELGNAANAAAIIGRRAVSQGVFLDRRVFLISYDPTIDPDGNVLEDVLSTVIPLCAGISLEYYFSTVNNDRCGSGTNVSHNVTGLHAVMTGASSDLRTGLPRQAVEAHEAMRLQVVVEARTDILTDVYGRQEILLELIGNRWLALISKDPETQRFAVFDPDRGFEPWTEPVQPIAHRATSIAWYRGHNGPLPPALIG